MLPNLVVVRQTVQAYLGFQKFGNAGTLCPWVIIIIIIIIIERT